MWQLMDVSSTGIAKIATYYNNNNNNPICKAPECQKTSVALKLGLFGHIRSKL